jgi:hypothetical protein
LREEIASPVIYCHRQDREMEQEENTYQNQSNRGRNGNGFPIQSVRIHQQAEKIVLEGWTRDAFQRLLAAYARRENSFDDTWEGSVCLTFEQRTIALLTVEQEDFYTSYPKHRDLFVRGTIADRTRALENNKEFFLNIIKFTCNEHDHEHGDQDFAALNRSLEHIKMEYFSGKNNIAVTTWCVKVMQRIQEANLNLSTNKIRTCLETIIR